MTAPGPRDRIELAVAVVVAVICASVFLAWAAQKAGFIG